MFKRRRSISFIAAVMLLAGAFLLNAADVPDQYEQGEALWSKNELESPLAVNGKINRGEGGAYSFELDKSGIPLETLQLVTSVNDSYEYDSEAVGFNGSAYNFLIGARLQSITPGTHSYTQNSSMSESSGSNIDLIKGATATLNVEYSPKNTHQKGCLWYPTEENRSFSSFSAFGGSDYCTVTAAEATFSVSDDGRQVDTIRLRALSIYDPWFDAMEERYDSAYGEDGDRIDNWKDRYLSLSDGEHKSGINEDLAEDDPLRQHDMWLYPSGEGDADLPAPSLYTDFQISIREPIEDIWFTSMAQTDVSVREDDGSGSTVAGDYVFIDDQELHPDTTKINEIWCWDTSAAAKGDYTIDAFYVEADMDPDFGYELEFEIVAGSGIGRLDDTNMDSGKNAFRFVPKGAYQGVEGYSETNYGAVTIKVTATEVGYSEYFTLYYMPSEGMIMKYIGEKGDEDHPGESVGADGSTVPEEWSRGAVVKASDRDSGDVMLDMDASGQWDVVKGRTTGSTQLIPLQTIVLDKGESFSLAAVAYVKPDSKPGSTKIPYYMTSGYPVINSSQTGGAEATWTNYAVTFTVYSTPTAGEQNEVKDAIAFPEYAVRHTNSDRTIGLRQSADVTATSYWYTEDALTITAQKEGLYYLQYTIVPVMEGLDNASLDEGMVGGLYVYVVDSLDQTLAAYLKGQGVQGSGRSRTNYALPVERYLSLGQKEKWFMGAYGLVGQVYNGTDTDNPDYYYGRCLASFADEIQLKDGWFNGYAGQYSTDVDTLTVGQGTWWAADTYEINDAPNAGACLDINPDPGALGQMQPSRAFAGSTLAVPECSVQLSDIDLLGENGVRRLGVRSLRIEEQDEAPGIITIMEKYSVIQGGRTVYDISSMAGLGYYEHINVPKSYSKEVDEMRFPSTLQVLDLGDAVNPNRLDCFLTFASDSSGQNGIKAIDVSYNDFAVLELTNMPKLRQVEAGGDCEPQDDSNSQLRIRDCDSLQWVSANGTRFSHLDIEFPADRTMTAEKMKDGSYAWKTLLRANRSDKLRSVYVSGGLTYLELGGDVNLEELTCSTNESVFTKGDLSTGSYVKTINLGGLNALHSYSSLPGKDNTAKKQNAVGFTNLTVPHSWKNSSGVIVESVDDGNNREETIYLDTIRIANVGRLLAPSDSEKATKDVEIGTVYGGGFSAIGVTAFDDVCYDMAVDLESLVIGTVAGGDTTVSFTNAGRDTGLVLQVNVNRLEGTLDFTNAGQLDGININSTVYDASQVPDSRVIMSGSLISNFSGAGTLSDVALSLQDGYELTEGTSTSFGVSVTPSSLLEYTDITVTSSNPSAISVTADSAHGSFTLEAGEDAGGLSSTISVIATCNGITISNRKITVNVIPEPQTDNWFDFVIEATGTYTTSTDEQGRTHYHLQKGSTMMLELKDMILNSQTDGGTVIQTSMGIGTADSPGMFTKEYFEQMLAQWSGDSQGDPGTWENPNTYFKAQWSFMYSDGTDDLDNAISYRFLNDEDHLDRKVEISANAGDAEIVVSVYVESVDERSPYMVLNCTGSPGETRYSIEMEPESLTFGSEYDRSQTVTLRMYDNWTRNADGDWGLEIPVTASMLEIGSEREYDEDLVDFTGSGAKFSYSVTGTSPFTIEVTPQSFGWDGLVVIYRGRGYDLVECVPISMSMSGRLSVNKVSFSKTLNANIGSTSSTTEDFLLSGMDSFNTRAGVSTPIKWHATSSRSANAFSGSLQIVNSRLPDYFSASFSGDTTTTLKYTAKFTGFSVFFGTCTSVNISGQMNYVTWGNYILVNKSSLSTAQSAYPSINTSKMVDTGNCWFGRTDGLGAEDGAYDGDFRIRSSLTVKSMASAIDVPDTAKQAKAMAAPAAAPRDGNGSAHQGGATMSDAMRKDTSAVFCLAGEVVATGCPNLTSVDLSAENNTTKNSLTLTLHSNANLKSLSISNGKVRRVVAYSCVITSVDIQSCPQLSYLDVHSNKLGSGTLRVGNFKYSNGSFVTMVSGANPREWKGQGNGLESLVAWGNGIRSTSTGTYQIGSEIPDDRKMFNASMYKHNDWWRGASVSASFAQWSEYDGGHRHGFLNCEITADVYKTMYYRDLSSAYRQSGAMAGAGKSGSGTITVWPFGE